MNHSTQSTVFHLKQYTLKKIEKITITLAVFSGVAFLLHLIPIIMVNVANVDSTSNYFGEYFDEKKRFVFTVVASKIRIPKRSVHNGPFLKRHVSNVSDMSPY